MFEFLKLLFGVFITFIIIGFALLIFEKFVTEKTININISLIEKKTIESGEVYFLVYTKNEIFENRDNYFHSKRNANLVGVKLRSGSSYQVQVVGYNFGIKIPFFQKYRNIIRVVKNNPRPKY